MYILKNLFTGQVNAKGITHYTFTESRVPRNLRFLMNAGFCLQYNRGNRKTTRLKLFEPTEAVVFAEERRKESFNALFAEDSRAETKPAFIGFIP